MFVNLGFACPDRPPVIDLSHNSWLQYVLVHVYVSSTTWVAEMLSLITSEHMAKLSIAIRVECSRFDRPDSPGWREMDAVLMQAQFATLEGIEIICDWKDVDVAAWFSALLPQCRDRGVLKFVTELPEFPSVRPVFVKANPGVGLSLACVAVIFVSPDRLVEKIGRGTAASGSSIATSR